MGECVNCKRIIPDGDIVCPDCRDEAEGTPNKVKEIACCEVCGQDLDENEIEESEDDEKLCENCRFDRDAEARKECERNTRFDRR